MEHADSIIKSALQEILVQASESSLTASEAQDAIRYMNRMMASFEVEGISIGYTTVTSLADPITVPDGALDGIVFNLATRLAASFDAQIRPDLFQKARSGKDAMYRLAQKIGATKFSSTLPRGSGNTGFYNDRHFYDQGEEPIITENSGYISIESGTGIDE